MASLVNAACREAVAKAPRANYLNCLSAAVSAPASHAVSDGSLRAALGYRPLLVLVALAFGARAGLMILYFPAVLLAFDSPRYARVGDWTLFGDFWMPAGYPMLLLLLRGISNQMWFTIAVQHLIGIATGGLLYVALWRIGVRRWVACIPAAVVFLSGDHLYLEHSVMADFLLTFFTAAGLCFACFALRQSQNLTWLMLASACFAAAALVRSVGVVLVPVLLVCVVLFGHGSARRRMASVLVVLLSAVAVFGSYWLAFRVSGGEFLGLSDMRGWNLYSRVAPFADCSKFAPPAGTEVVCEETPPARRPGPFGYVWDLESVPRKTFPLGPETGKKLEQFAFRTIRSQPGDYLRAVGVDLARYILPSLGGARVYSGQPRELISFGWRDPKVEQMVVDAMAWSYEGVQVRVRAQQFLAAYQNVMRVGGIALLVLLALTLGGVWRASGEVRGAICVFGLAALGLYTLPVLSVSYDFRYGIPPSTFLVVSGVLGAVTLFGPARRELAPRAVS